MKKWELYYLIPAAPVTKKNSQQILTNKATGRAFVMPSKQYREYEATAGYFLQPKPKNGPITEPVNVTYLFYMPTRRKVDVANLISAADDILVKYGILADDNRDIIAGHDGTRVHYDKANPRTEIVISPIPEIYLQWKPLPQQEGGPEI